jgi:hypothetical protein
MKTMAHEQNTNGFAHDCAAHGGNPLIFEDDRDTIEATRDYLSELVRAGAMDLSAPRGRILSLQVAHSALDHLAKKVPSLVVNPENHML